MVFLFILFIICILLLFYLKLNEGQRVRLLTYQYKYIPEPLVKYVIDLSAY
ncbi:hypothetical protein AsGV055 [Agrotis segetum granulovirus]|uniref:PIF-7 n=1 Tax=Agrotis segetum granulosis virus TaxID=10464 RepID=A0A023MIL2_GVAS|nr:hypothetical protein AsGV055 [Agrotis segetum granulovirus]AHN92094.1 hypothetical protein AsGV055 [Agrotis segetum granulovirus]AKN63329.1 hypothetical protein AsGV055 [Agrotis segetum granulovirus]